MAWLSAEAEGVREIFLSLFYQLICVFILVGVVCETFKLPLGGMPSVTVLVGRAFIAAILLEAYPYISNNINLFTESLANKIGDFHKIELVLDRMSLKLEELTFSWVSVKDTVLLSVCYLAFFLLYFTVFVAEGVFLFCWVLAYVFSPLLIALFVLPVTANATSTLFRTLFEVSCWKIVWAALATLLWSSALSEINQPGYEVNFVSVVCFNLILAGSLILTPWVVHALADAGLSSVAKSVGSVNVGSMNLSPRNLVRSSKKIINR